MTCRDGVHLERTRHGRAPEGLALLLSTLLFVPAGVAGQGFGIYEQGACVMGRAGAAVAAPCGDGSTLFFNPAGLADSGHLTLSLGAAAIYPEGSFAADQGGTATELENGAVPLGHAYATFPVGHRISGGLGIYAPYGLETLWPLDFAGRFVGYDNKLQTLYVQGTLATRITDRVMVGAGPIVAISSVQLNRRLDLAGQPVPPGLGAPEGAIFAELGVPRGSDFVDATVDSDEAVGYGGAAGILVRPHGKVRVGARYLSSVTLDYEGFAGFTPVETGLRLPADNPLGLPEGTSVDSLLEASGIFLTGGPFTGQEVAATLELPAQVVAGVSVEALEGLLVAADWQRTLWSSVDRVVLDFAEEATPDDALVLRYEDANTFRVGAEYRALPELTLRGGFIHNEAASPPTSVTPILPEAARNHLTVGLGWAVSEQIHLDAAYQLLSQEDRRGRVRNPLGGEEPTTALNEGVYAFDGRILSATLSWRFR